MKRAAFFASAVLSIAEAAAAQPGVRSVQPVAATAPPAAEPGQAGRRHCIAAPATSGAAMQDAPR